ncbi:FAD-binding oxidoreductase [Nakamurella antarctica]|uniref:D-lactate dehydrogenase (cytochrome) n=1 Tax=Nakamurella antarctica TaxID=1902245 RepID=A0A3G8ZJM0_9ACTN|nr:FAD-binding and (Fe-S)-binding domain-containing protein [Nakamurella antarctica]AZI56977.1 FAD-binding oxidoreductase [Nakamurella antarctica]
MSSTLPAPPPQLLADLSAAMLEGGTVRSRATDRLAMAHDASHFLLTPSAIATPINAAEVGRLLRTSAAHGIPLTFRSGGTSLSGQAVTDGVLVDTRRNFREIEIIDDGHRVRIGPGATVRQVNTRLAKFGRKLGPDPASESACTLGGVVANNSSGMACGTVANTYNTLDSVTLVLPSGTVIDTGASDADARLKALEPELFAGLDQLRERIRHNPASVTKLQQQFSMKNTMGYGLNSFLDYDTPAQILAHLVVGSEGTLAFIASVVMRTVPLLSHSMTGLLVFESLDRATGSLPELVATGPATIELLDATSLRVSQSDPSAAEILRSITVRNHAALLVEYQAQSALETADLSATAYSTLRRLPLERTASLSADPRVRAKLWHTRKGLYAAVAQARPSGTTALLEDVAVPLPALLNTCQQLTRLFESHAYSNSVIFGHAKDGNIHFMLTEKLGGGSNLDRFTAFTEDMVQLILSNGGSLKAEHGTGRMMAPYVRRQYGDELYDVMREVKRLCDPAGTLNPGVVISDDKDAHVRDLKVTPTIEAEVDGCVECGYCEPVCPSKDLTTTPRQRIVLRREMERARLAGDSALLSELAEQFDYDAVQTCAVDGMCQTACPVLINTGDLVKRLRADTAGKLESTAWRSAARHWAGSSTVASLALTVTQKLPEPLVRTANSLGRKVISKDTLPLWSSELPAGGVQRERQRTVGHADAVYFTACVGAIFGPTDAGPGVREAFEQICDRAGVSLAYPKDLPGLCCGTPWRSKGMTKGYEHMAAIVLPALWAASRQGKIPIVCDASSCTEGLRQMQEHATESPDWASLRIIDVVEFVEQEVLGKLRVRRKVDSLALHPTCSSTRMGLNSSLHAVADALATVVTVPESWGCCGFAGDRGLLHPELTASATEAQAAELAAGNFSAYASCNRTCELGMTRASGSQYQHVLELLAWACSEVAD